MRRGGWRGGLRGARAEVGGEAWHAGDRLRERGLVGGVALDVGDAGRTLPEPLRALWRWSIEHVGDVTAAQRAYDHAR
ncbi:hypothetical protein [Catenuloplanes indicus]|uniref:Uncharacterized protein n=1 Tax=Catenuloplanes indicus TaxID=137267 RepID=A0AAE3VWI7_9ACTN|nr:hypothetical protein [Catenuloplanes indicus]MDQ0364902.1 hypothetical protein [Catenuloplanes indicus]